MGLTRVRANATLCQPVSPSLVKPSGDKRMRRSVRYALCLFAGLPALLGAQGFGIYEQGACSMGRAGTGVAAPCTDGSAIFFNPAGLAGLKGGRATVGLTLLDVEGGFTDDIFQHTTKLNDPFLAIPQVYVAYRSEEHTSELQSQSNLVCRLLLEKKKKNKQIKNCTHNRI